MHSTCPWVRQGSLSSCELLSEIHRAQAHGPELLEAPELCEVPRDVDPPDDVAEPTARSLGNRPFYIILCHFMSFYRPKQVLQHALGTAERGRTALGLSLFLAVNLRLNPSKEVGFAQQSFVSWLHSAATESPSPF